ncbi:MAG: RimK family alpha-L-glutamate ligase [Candidatus Sigynarchaeota archaeon]
MVKCPYPVASLEDPAQVSLCKHLFCLDPDTVPVADLEAIARHYLPEGSPGVKAVLDLLEARLEGKNWTFVNKNAAKQSALNATRERIAFINGREDEGHSLKRYKEELARKGIQWDEYWLDQISLGSAGLAGFPADPSYRCAILTNPEPLESDSAPMFLLKAAAIEAIEARCPVFPTRLADTAARSKLANLITFTRNGIATPETLVTASISEGAGFVKKMHQQGKDVVIKPLAKGGGWGVGKIPRGAPEARVLDILGKYKWWYGDGVLLLQEFIENKGYDKRVLVLGDLILGTERRSATLDTESWIYNISKGASGTRDVLDEAERLLVLNAAKAMGQVFCGVDLVRGLDGRDYILEVNSTPGFKGFEQNLGVNVASMVLDYLLFFGS